MMNRPAWPSPSGDKGKYEIVHTCLKQFRRLDMNAERSAVVSEWTGKKNLRPTGGSWDALVYDDDAILARFIALVLGATPAEDPDPEALLEAALRWAVQEAETDMGRSYPQHPATAVSRPRKAKKQNPGRKRSPKR
jgi:hypothetical protein